MTRLRKHGSNTKSKEAIAKRKTRNQVNESKRKKRRFRTDTNHCVSKHLVEKAKNTNVGIALEDLSGVTKRTTVRKIQRAKRHSWLFYQLRQFITYKAKLKEVPVVDPRNISRQCPECGHIAKANRKNQAEFCCKKCGYSENADYNDVKNIAVRAVSTSLLSSAKELSKVA
jgi:IS605 OrfB family transposase